MLIRKLSQLTALRDMRGYESIKIHFNERIFPGNLPLYLIKYGLWALRPGGFLYIEAPALIDSMVLRSSRLPFQLFVQIAVRASNGWATLTEVDLLNRRLTLKRTASYMEDSWSAGIIFSGNVHELPYLERCIHALRLQQELIASKDIVIFGPASGERLVKISDGIRYIICETPKEAGRFLIGQKKNMLLEALQNDKALICHSRMLLNPGALASLPKEFDLITPRVLVQGHEKSLPYLDLGFMGLKSISMTGIGVQPPIYYNRNLWRENLGDLYPYIDGGLFCVRRSMALSEPLNKRIAWGEGEDAEWCIRLLNNGHLIELADNPRAVAYSSTCKTQRYAKYGHLWFYRKFSHYWRFIKSYTGRLCL